MSDRAEKLIRWMLLTGRQPARRRLLAAHASLVCDEPVEDMPTGQQLDVLHRMDERERAEGRAAMMSEIARDMGIKPPTLHELTTHLIAKGYAEKIVPHAVVPRNVRLSAKGKRLLEEIRLVSCEAAGDGLESKDTNTAGQGGPECDE